MWQYANITAATNGVTGTSFPSLGTDCATPPTMPVAPNELIDALGKPWVNGTSTGTQFRRSWDGCTPTGSGGTRKRIYLWVQWTDPIGVHTVSLSRERNQ
jgi:hypothetical protein